MKVPRAGKSVHTSGSLLGCHGIWTSHNGTGGHCDAYKRHPSASYIRLYQNCPSDRVARRRGVCVKSPKLQRQRQGWPLGLRAQAGSPPPARWNLDDVERISRGRPSKAKTGSRAVPHRLNAEERKEFELAKKRGYVVQKAEGRRYPLVNTYRNYCDALGMPCIRIEQGTGMSLDQVVIDLSPLRLSDDDHISLQEKVSTAVKGALATDERTQGSFAAEDAGIQLMEQDNRSVVSELSEDEQDLIDPKLADSLSSEIPPLRFEANRSEARALSGVVVDVWRNLSSLFEINQIDRA